MTERTVREIAEARVIEWGEDYRDSDGGLQDIIREDLRLARFAVAMGEACAEMDDAEELSKKREKLRKMYDLARKEGW